MHFQPNNDAGSRAQGLKLTPLLGDGNENNSLVISEGVAISLKLTPLLGDGN